MAAWKWLCELFVGWIRNHKLPNQDSWAITKDHWAAGASLSPCEDNHNWDTVVSPIIVFPRGYVQMRKRCRGMDQTVLWLITFVPLAFPISPTPVHLRVIYQSSVTVCE